MVTTIKGTEYLTAPQAAKRLGVGNRTVHNWVQQGLFADVVNFGPNAGTRYLIPATSLDGFVPPSHRAGHVRGWRAGEKRGGGDEDEPETD